MGIYRFQVTLLASIAVKAKASAEAERKLRAAISASDANLGILDGKPIVATLDIEGEIAGAAPSEPDLLTIEARADLAVRW